MAGLSQRLFAKEAGVSRQAVGRAVARGLLQLGGDGKIDPANPTNACWCARHAEGIDDIGRAFRPDRIGRSVVDDDAKTGMARLDFGASPGPLFSDWDEVFIDARQADVLFKFAERLLELHDDGANCLAYLCAMVEGLRSRAAEQLAYQAVRIAELEAEIEQLRAG